MRLKTMNDVAPYVMRVLIVLLLFVTVVALSACGDNAAESESVTARELVGENSAASSHLKPDHAYQQRMVNATDETGNWLLHGRTYSEQRFSPLEQINHLNVSRLGHAWSLDMNSTRGLEATPIVRDGIMYTTGIWSIVYAVDAATGEMLWSYDPKVPRAWARKGCCDVVNRGVAVWGESVFVGTFDGRLVALDAKSGRELWQRNTIDRSKSATITGAPRVVNGKVIIGNGGAEFDVRGYVSAYDAVSGERLWRFYTVPASLEGPHENPELEIAAKTWGAEGAWRQSGGGGTVWDSIAYDPDLNLLYVGTGNGAPHARHIRDKSQGDNLFLSSILALDADSGEMKWYYQTTPRDSWDFTATQHMVLADIEIAGKYRKVLMQAPKNGFFYVLDRETGELISADNYVAVNWASHVNLETGRPVETGQGDYSQEDKLVFPSELGGHNWHPMSYSPVTNLVYIPAQERGWIHSPNNLYLFDYNLPEHFDELSAGQPIVDEGGYLKAWDPVDQRVTWQVKNNSFINGGTLATGGNLVFQGTEDGYLNAYNAETGEQLLNLFLGTGVIASPISYAIGEKQYIAIMAGFGGASLFMLDETAAARTYANSGRLIALELDGGDIPLPEKVVSANTDQKPESTVDAALNDIQRGEQLYVRNCGFCHGFYGSKSILPDLTGMSSAVQTIFDEIVLDGVFESKGMASFSDVLNEEEVEQIKLYLIQPQ